MAIPANQRAEQSCIISANGMAKKPASNGWGNKAVGQQGETLAATYLKQQGLKILDRNFRTRRGEIDLIAKERQELVFVEVKTRRDDQAGYPEEAVKWHKIRALMRAAWFYSQKHPDLPQAWRIDVVAIQWKDGQPSIRWFKNVSPQFS